MAEEITPAATRAAAGWHVMPPRAGHMAGDVRPPGQTCLARPRGAPQLGERAPPACKCCLLGRPCTPAMEGASGDRERRGIKPSGCRPLRDVETDSPERLTPLDRRRTCWVHRDPNPIGGDLVVGVDDPIACRL